MMQKKMLHLMEGVDLLLHIDVEVESTKVLHYFFVAFF